MRFAENETNNASSCNPSVTVQKAEETPARMQVGSENSADVFQAELYNAGQGLLSQLRKIEGLKELEGKTYEELQERLFQLRDFHFNIGFAGGMSSGKSTVINSLIEYPLMPTCKLTTTCVGTHMFYGETPRISVIDDDTGKQVLNVDCTKLSPNHFQKLKEYACITTHVKIIENLQHFTGHNLFDDKDSFQPDMLNMDRNNPNHVIILMMILLTVYVDQNSMEMNAKTKAANEKRKEVLDFFNFNSDTVNYTIQLQWNGDFLKSGMTITDLPGLGAYAPDKDQGDGKVVKGHDSITTNAIKKTDAMVFLVDPQVDGTAVPALQAMLSNAQMMEAVNQSDLVIPILNKVDDCKGKAEVEQAVDKFVSILKDTGVDKNNDDVHLYSAWYGEAKFKDFSDDRTCFFFRNYEAFREDVLDDAEDDLSEAELHREIMKKSKKKLVAQYRKAGIDELKRFFRDAYISKSKNRRSQAAVLTVIKLANEMIPQRKLQLEKFDLLQGLAGSLAEDITKGLKASIDEPISAVLNAIAEVDHSDTNTYVRENLADIPELYVSAFRKALDDYKLRNKAVCGKFDLNWGGLGDKARIDVLGSFNRGCYNSLCAEMDKIGVDLKSVNEKYIRILKRVTKENENLYGNALRYLQELKTSIIKSMDDYVDHCKETVKDDQTVVVSVEALKDTLVDYLEKQIIVIVDNMSVNQDNLTKAGNKTVRDIFDLNTEMVNMYTKSVVGDVKSKLSAGWFFKDREFIQIYGTGGCLEIFNNLSLSEQDATMITDQVETIGITSISNNLIQWYQSAENLINENFTDLREQLSAMMDNTVEVIGGDADQIEKQKQELQKILDEIEAAFKALRKNVQTHYDASVEGIADDTLSKYRENMFMNIIDMDAEEQNHDE